MPLDDERPTSSSSSSGEDQGSQGSSGRCDSLTSASDMDCSRESFTSESSSKHCTPSSSPPKIITMDDVIAAAKDLNALSLAHEIIVNRDFHVELPKLAQSSLEKRVSDMLHRSYWGILASELNQQPPKYDLAIQLLEEIQEIFLSSLICGSNRLKTQIMAVLDMDLIRQQADNDAVDIQGLASYIISTMGKMCAPIRKEEVNKLQEARGDVVTLFKEIFRVLQLMKMDVLDYTIEVLRPDLLQNSVECERALFQTILDKTPNALNHTTSWIRAALEECVLNPAEQSSGLIPSPLLVMDVAFLRILSWDPTKSPFPETLFTDEGRLMELQRDLRRLQTVLQVLLIVNSAVGGPIQGLSSLADRLKTVTCVLLDGMHRPDFDLEEALRGASGQICCELNKSLTERGYPGLTPALQATLTGQVCSIVQEGNPIRTLVEERVRQYLLRSDPAKLVPAGLAPVEPELVSLATRFHRVTYYNLKIYRPFYMRILTKLMFDIYAPPTLAATVATTTTPPPPSSPAAAPAPVPVPSSSHAPPTLATTTTAPPPPSWEEH